MGLGVVDGGRNTPADAGVLRPTFRRKVRKAPVLPADAGVGKRTRTVA